MTGVDRSTWGSGGGGSTYVAPPSVDDPVSWSADLGYDYEFGSSSNSLPAGWAWVNQHGSTYREDYGAGLITVALKSGTYDLSAIVRSLPAGNWTLTAKLSGLVSAVGGATDYQHMLLLRDSGTGKLVDFTRYGSTGGLYAEKWDDPNTISGNFFANAQLSGIPSYYRITKTSSSAYTYAASLDGVAWRTIGTYDLSAHLTPDQFGFGSSTDAGTAAIQVACHWIRLR